MASSLTIDNRNQEDIDNWLMAENQALRSEVARLTKLCEAQRVLLQEEVDTQCVACGLPTTGTPAAYLESDADPETGYREAGWWHEGCWRDRGNDAEL